MEDIQNKASPEHGAKWLSLIFTDFQSKYGYDIATIEEGCNEGGSDEPGDARSEAGTMPVPNVPDAPPAPDPSISDPRGAGGDAALPGVIEVSIDADEDAIMTMPTLPTISCISTRELLMLESTGQPIHPSYGADPSLDAQVPLATTSTFPRSRLRTRRA